MSGAPSPVVADIAAHWEAVYRAKTDQQVSWHQDLPEIPLRLIRGVQPNPGRIIDVGGGASNLAAHLAALGHAVTVLDISPAALERSRAKCIERGLDPDGPSLHFIAADITAIDALDPHDVWHDRAVFHFLTADAHRHRYVRLASRTVAPGGHAIISAFSPEGPEQCSGLPVRRYDAITLAEAFAPTFAPVGAHTSTHTTPWGRPQAFIHLVLRRTVG